MEVREGEGDKLKWARLEPYHGYKLSFEIEFAHRVVDSTGQRWSSTWAPATYARDIARARTFGFTKDVETDARQRPRPGRQAWTTPS